MKDVDVILIFCFLSMRYRFVMIEKMTLACFLNFLYDPENIQSVPQPTLKVLVKRVSLYIVLV